MSDGITRRQFLATAATVSAGLALGGGALADERPIRNVRLGVVGVGARGTFLLETSLAFPNVEIPAVCDVDVNAAKRAQGLVEQKTGRRPTAYTRNETDWKNLCDRDDLDAVIIAAPWEWHAPIAIASMRAGKYVGTEVPACLTMKECWDLVKTSEETGMPCMMLENVNYMQPNLAITQMLKDGALGEMQHAEAGYQHDCRFLAFTEDGQLTWRGRHMAEKNGNLYPTHPIGPIAWWMNINRGNRFMRLSSISTKPRSMRNYAERKFGADHPLARREYALGDVNTTLIEVSNGMTVTLYFDLCSPRPYDMIFRVQGTKGVYEGTHDRIHVEGITPADGWETFSTKYLSKYEHSLWREYGTAAVQNGGHGGCDYIVVGEFLKSVRNRTQTPQDVYDAATWSAIVPLSIESVSKHGHVVDFPDFTEGKWKTRTTAS